MALELDKFIGIAGIVTAIFSVIVATFIFASRRRDFQLERRFAKEVPHTEVFKFDLKSPAPSSCQIGIVTGDIMQVKIADIWVNGENTDMEMARVMDFSISGIIRYWGANRDAAGRVIKDTIADELAIAAGNERPVAPGSAFVTSAGALTESNGVQQIIHVAAVQGEPGAGFHQVRNIGMCVTNSLMEADRLAAINPAIRSILFPLLGTGVGQAEVGPTVDLLVGAALNYLDATPQTSLSAVYFLAYTDFELHVLMRAAKSSPHLVPAE